jgi:hypothetical protein
MAMSQIEEMRKENRETIVRYIGAGLQLFLKEFSNSKAEPTQLSKSEKLKRYTAEEDLNILNTELSDGLLTIGRIQDESKDQIECISSENSFRL